MNTTPDCFDIPHPNAGAAIRLLCFHHAGGGASLFRSWTAALQSHAELVLVQLPGREQRRGQALQHHLADVVASVLPAVLGLRDKPMTLFGHSMGALVALQLARELAAAGEGKLLRKLILSACHPPHWPRERISRLPEAQFLDRLRAMGGTPPEILQDADMMALFLPILRADFAVCESSIELEGPPLSCPLLVYGGIDDAIALDDLASWRRYSDGSFQMKLFPGGHFYLRSERALLLKNLLVDL